MMKSSMSLAVLALLQNTSATEVLKHHKHQAGRRSNLAQQRRRIESPFYKETKAGANWFDLDDPSERLHGTEDNDFKTAYDPEVVDAPEDLPRVGNDHEELSNAKLAPEGYYNGFFHKDFEGNYAQKAMRARKAHKKHHHHKRHPQYVQYDHKEDTDDFLYDSELKAVENDATNIQFNHDGDQDDLDLEMPEPNMRGAARQRMAEDESWNQFFQKGAKDQLAEGNLVQLADEDEELAPRKRGEPFQYFSELKDDKQAMQIQKMNEDVIELMQQQAKEDKNADASKEDKIADTMNVQLDYAHIPHAEDTEDVYDDGSDVSYDHHHSKEWNTMVQKKADELEDIMKTEEQDKIAAKKAAEDAKRKAIEEKAKQEAEKRKKAQELAQHKNVKAKVQTVDFNDIYNGITPDEITLQLDENVGYEHHSKFWNNQIEEQTASLEKTIQAEDEAEKKTGQVYGTTDGLTQEKFMSAEDREAEEQKTHHKTVDLEEVYDGMTVQLSDHSLYWENRVQSAQTQLEDLMRKQEEPVYSQENTSIDQNELYNGMAVQTSDHSKYWENRVSSAQEQLEDLMRKQDEPVYSQENTSIDQNELYNGMAVQLGDKWDIHSENWYATQAEIQNQVDQEEEREQVMALQQRYAEPQVPEEEQIHRATIDQAELYDDIALMTSDKYDIHSKNWYNEQEKTENYWNMQESNGEPQSWNPTSHVSTIDQGELYNGMAVQLADKWDTHSKNWYNQQEKTEKILSSQSSQQEEVPVSHTNTINQGELYNGMAVQLADKWDTHSKNWYNQQEKTEQILSSQSSQEEVPVSHVNTINQGQLYNGMAIQLNGIHSENYERMVAQQERAFNAAEAEREADMTPAEKKAEFAESHPVYVTDNHIVATSMIPEHKNFDVDTSIYNGLSANPKINDYVQLADHDEDQDDIVPEFSEEVKPAQEQQMVEQKHFDFQGQEFKETYDE